ncbi:unnamed protein product [Pleuronectes platessa]|uniref:Uncharacterized protein n=1 Tax=Pleuronectes platessa TaxID=8262 RepID=A0A9N7VJP8_PLEPL|nr:unnamed protein product [Pleuronectes platessa]
MGEERRRSAFRSASTSGVAWMPDELSPAHNIFGRAVRSGVSLDARRILAPPTTFLVGQFGLESLHWEKIMARPGQSDYRCTALVPSQPEAEAPRCAKAASWCFSLRCDRHKVLTWEWMGASCYLRLGAALKLPV